MGHSSRNAMLVVNPSARGVRNGKVDAPGILRSIQRNGWEAILVQPPSPEATTDAARSSAERGDALCFVLGGDGSLRDAAAGLAGSETALAPLPGGTVNILAKELGIPRNVRAAVEAHVSGQVARMDLGTANGRYFLLMASAGWDAAAANRVSPWLKRRAGDAAYIASFARLIPGLRLQGLHWRAGDSAEDVRVVMFVVSNTRVYGGRVNFAPNASACDGLLDITAVCPGSLLGVPRVGVQMALNRIASDRSVISLQTAELVIETEGIPYQVDGDFAGLTPVTFGVAPGALAVSVPAGELPAVLRPPADD